MKMSNSPLVSYTKLSPNHSGKRKVPIDTITIHCVVGHASLETLGNIFLPTSRQASCNYGIDDNGKVGMYVEEDNRSWCTSSSANDQRAVTIEVASDNTAPYKVTDKALKGLIELCADICKRNGIKQLLWKGDKSLIGQTDKQNMSVHRWFANKSCPGDYLYEKHGYIADEVTKFLQANNDATGVGKPTVPTEKEIYRVRAKWNNADTQQGAFTVLDNAKALADKLNNKVEYFVYNSKGEIVYPK